MSESISLTSLPSASSIYQPTMFNYERPKHFIQSQLKCQGEPTSPAGTAPKQTNVVAKSTIFIQPQSFIERKPPPLCPTTTSVPTLTVSISSSKKPDVTEKPQSTSISVPEHNIAEQCKQEQTDFRSISPFNNKKVERNISYELPDYSKYATKNVTKPSQMTDRDIQGTKDALIQDLERKLKFKDDILHNGNQRLTYEEKMARRLLGPQNAASVFEDQSAENTQDPKKTPRGENTARGNSLLSRAKHKVAAIRLPTTFVPLYVFANNVKVIHFHVKSVHDERNVQVVKFPIGDTVDYTTSPLQQETVIRGGLAKASVELQSLSQYRVSGSDFSQTTTFTNTNEVAASSIYQPTMFNYERPKHFIQSQLKCQGEPTSPAGTAPKQTNVVAKSTIFIQPQSFIERKPPPLCPTTTSVPTLTVSISSSKKPDVTEKPQSTSISVPEHNIEEQCKQEQTDFRSISPFNNKKVERNISYELPDYSKYATKNVTKPSQMTDRDIQGTKDALIQDLERKLKFKDDILHNGNQRLTYEEKMARRLLGPQNAASVFEDQSAENTQDPKQMSERIQNYPPKPRSRSSTEGGNEHVVEEGRFCRIDFKVTGLPNPDITWYMNGRLIQADDLHKMIVSEKGVHSFIFEVVQACDAGLYKCIATNRAGEAFFNLQFDVRAQEYKIPPYFIKKPAATRAYEGDNVQMECQIRASPQPNILLKKNNEMLQYNTDRISTSPSTSSKYKTAEG
ncbi:myotilin isoform X1 [Pelobates cultripes]|uniref:Myotilin isoform X1 n=1 Tax=Pelobates cultripes TaxID=61616 RepID=A0AAD1RR62_PELCU|nr:myotilin isoform X1 [Pelobates cultripes]